MNQTETYGQFSPAMVRTGPHPTQCLNAPKPPDPPSPMFEAREVILDRLGVIMDRIDLLERRLSPVLQPTAPATDSSANQAGQPMCSPLRGALLDHAAVAHRAVLRLEDLLARLEV